VTEGEIIERLRELTALPVGWCSYCPDCQPVRQPTADTALRVVREVGVPPENVVPIKSSGAGGSWVQIEWYPPGHYVEIEVNPAGTFNYMLSDRAHDVGVRRHRIRAALDFDDVVWIAKLALRLVADAPPADRA
jgi:hypothetical protein